MVPGEWLAHVFSLVSKHLLGRVHVDVAAQICSLRLPQGQEETEPTVSVRLQRVESGDLLVFPETAEGYVDKVPPCQDSWGLCASAWMENAPETLNPALPTATHSTS